MRLIIYLFFIMVAITLSGNGCSRKSGDTGNAAINVQTNSAVGATNPAAAAAQFPPPASDAMSTVQANGQPNLDELNRVARLWMYRNHRRPNDWDDFAANAGVQIPPPPPGKKYALSNSMHVTLVNR